MGPSPPLTFSHAADWWIANAGWDNAITTAHWPIHRHGDTPGRWAYAYILSVDRQKLERRYPKGLITENRSFGFRVGAHTGYIEHLSVSRGFIQIVGVVACAREA